VRRRDAWALPGTFLHERETLADAVRRSLEQKAGLRDAIPRQLHVFDDPERDDRGWVLSVAHAALLPWRLVAPVVEAREDDVAPRPVAEVAGLPFHHDEIVRLAVEEVPRPIGVIPIRSGSSRIGSPSASLRHLHEAIAGRRLGPDSFGRLMTPQAAGDGPGEGRRRRPAGRLVRQGPQA
jgi:8-oxo-dGTP diphosphatase